MKLVTFSHNGSTRIGVLVESNGSVLDLSGVDAGLPTDMIAFLAAGPAALAKAKAALQALPAGALLPAGQFTLQAPIPRPGKLLCMGHNYIDHSAMAPGTLPEFPNLFLKAPTAITGPNQPVRISAASDKVDYEGEFCFVIGKTARNVPESEAMDYVAGYTILNDVTARDFAGRVSQWMVGKSFDTFAPLGPALVTKDEVPDPGQLELVLTVNGEVRQHSNTGNTIFSIPFLIAYLSQAMTLDVGDVISTGTPSGSGAGLKPPVFLKAGDVVSAKVEKIGELVSPIAVAAE
jgi:acylpyruvate hydrolase